jgi:hypothetical protein
MPAPIIYQQDQGLAQGISQAGSALGGALGQIGMQEKAEQQRLKQIGEQQAQNRKYGSIVNKAIATIDENSSGMDILGTLNKVLNEGVPMDYLKPILGSYEGAIKNAFQRDESDKFWGTQQPGQPGQPQQNLEEQYIQQPMDTDQIQQQQPQQNRFASLTDAQLIQAQANPNQMISKGAKAEEARRVREQQQSIAQQKLENQAAYQTQRLEQSRFATERAHHAKISDKAITDASLLEKSIRGKEGALQIAREAIESGETGPLSWANISKRLDVPELMNQKGTQLSQAGKEFFFGNMQKVSAKAQNQWLEQRITQLSAQVGDTEASALTKQVMLEGELDLDKAYVESFNRLASEDEEKYGYVKNDIERRAYNDSQKAADKILNKISFETRQIYENEKGAKWILDNATKKVPKGTPLTPKMAKALLIKYKSDSSKVIENAKKLGYSIPGREYFE